MDFIFYPETDHTADGIILELKVNDTPKKALQQIRDRNKANSYASLLILFNLSKFFSP